MRKRSERFFARLQRNKREESNRLWPRVKCGAERSRPACGGGMDDALNAKEPV